MLTEIIGDILGIKTGIICHQTNYYGAMGAGVAAAIADKILTDEQYTEYVAYCKNAGRTALGTVQFIECTDGLVVANMFCQDDARTYSADAKNYNITDYGAMRRCLVCVRSKAMLLDKQVYFPHKIGCGIAGGNWDTVKHIIGNVFINYPVEAFIVRRRQGYEKT